MGFHFGRRLCNDHMIELPRPQCKIWDPCVEWEYLSYLGLFVLKEEEVLL